jgi:anti-sigma B factor antagonist
MELDRKTSGGKRIIRVRGRVDTLNAADFERRVCEEMGPAGPGVVLDLEELGYISSAGLRSVLSVAKKLKAQGRGICLCCLQGMVREVFEISGFNRMLPVLPTLEAALEQPLNATPEP